MALPKLNDSPKYDIVVPSTKQKVRYRPYLVKEEKVLMLAMESQDMSTILKTVVDTIRACVVDELDVLTIFDVEYMFTQIRSKSVGESSKIGMKCKSCEEQNEISIDVSKIEIDVPEISNIIELTDEITLEMRWPSYEDIIDLGVKDQESVEQNAFAMIGKTIAAICTEEERVDIKDVPQAEIDEFIESMTRDQFQLVSEYIGKMPSLNHEVSYTCTNCEEENVTTLRGMSDFF